MRVLIVGCGYVGVPLGAELVRLGHEIFGLRRNPAAENELKTAGIQPLFADVTKLEELKNLPHEFDWVVNCVATGGNAENYREVYFNGTKNLIEWLAPNPPKKFVYTSSTSVYAQNDGSLVKESSPTEPLAETSKILVETEKILLAAVAERQFLAVILRVAGIYGPERGHWFKQFMRDAAHIEGDGSRCLNMIHRDDLVGCIIAALKNGRAGEIYNAVDEEPVSQSHFFQWLAQAVDKPLPTSEPENPDAIRRRGVTNKRVSNRKLKMEFGYQFKYPTFRQGYSAELLRLHSGTGVPPVPLPERGCVADQPQQQQCDGRVRISESRSPREGAAADPRRTQPRYAKIKQRQRYG
jgi:nucleoside-diphosphate-sugar epimerase